MAWYSRSAASDAARCFPSPFSSVSHSSPASSRTCGAPAHRQAQPCAPYQAAHVATAIWNGGMAAMSPEASSASVAAMI